MFCEAILRVLVKTKQAPMPRFHDSVPWSDKLWFLNTACLLDRCGEGLGKRDCVDVSHTPREF